LSFKSCFVYPLDVTFFKLVAKVQKKIRTFANNMTELPVEFKEYTRQLMGDERF
jgi:hypothetical protein